MLFLSNVKYYMSKIKGLYIVSRVSGYFHSLHWLTVILLRKIYLSSFVFNEIFTQNINILTLNFILLKLVECLFT